MDEFLERETAKYKKIWAKSAYSLSSNEIKRMGDVIRWAQLKPIRKVLVVGCGEGFGIHRLQRAGYNAFGMDLVNVLKFPDYIQHLQIAPIWKSFVNDKTYDLCIAIDVLEHIPPEKIEDSLKEIERISKFFYMIISCRPDKLGAIINEPLHLTVKDPVWWYIQIQKYFEIERYSGIQTEITISGRSRV